MPLQCGHILATYELMHACAKKGGVVGLNGIGAFLAPGEDLVERLLRHLRYCIEQIGPEHVGLGFGLRV
jgi:membrane dipeptidase